MSVTDSHSTKGFTLIELSIVLVIIGLIVGGILTGQSLIKAAELRATLAQVEKYNTAVEAFRNKYNCIPGDCLVTNAIAFGITNNINFSGGPGDGDGNGIIEAFTGNDAGFLEEPPMFWLEISASGLIDGNYLTTLSTTGLIPTAVPTVPASTYMPPAKMGRGNYITVGSANGYNYFVMTAISAITTTGTVTSTNNITAQEAYDMDRKIDDGMPVTGSVRAIDSVTMPLLYLNSISTYANSTNAPNCVTAAPAYALTQTNPGCSLIFRMN